MRCGPNGAHINPGSIKGLASFFSSVFVLCFLPLSSSHRFLGFQQISQLRNLNSSKFNYYSNPDRTSISATG
ncbi:hypothetical protein HanRHA438_Chr16g0782011 [Helianthus annuus]|nr:hypothetical protein HanHA89_Chr16g0680171 [Helianthus annuus]KAJ0683155.1 hypothetical protein HanPI659440_Chr16g0655271 [Helianthus annuus]KAJ0837789.1 hypothetical protein HanRHA438_Chr16g0782011 [Helianthus annuus]